MAYADEAKAWIQSSPYVDVPVGRFTIRLKLSMDRDWGWVWEYMSWLTPKEYSNSPEEAYLLDIYDSLNVDFHDMEFIDVLLKEMQEKPFKGE